MTTFLRQDAIPHFATLDSQGGLTLLNRITFDLRRLKGIFQTKDVNLELLKELCPEYFQRKNLGKPLTIVYVATQSRAIKTQTITVTNDFDFFNASEEAPNGKNPPSGSTPDDNPAGEISDFVTIRQPGSITVDLDLTGIE